MKNLPAPNTDFEDTGDKVIRVFEDAPELLEVTSLTNIHKVIDDDLAHVQFVLARVKEAWGWTGYDIDAVCKLAMTTTKILKDRRELMQTHSGPMSSARSDRNNVSSPYDD